MIGGFQPLAFQPAYQQVGIAHVDIGGHFGIVGKPKRKKEPELEEIREEIVAVAQQVEQPTRDWRIPLSDEVGKLEKLLSKLEVVTKALDGVEKQRAYALHERALSVKLAAIEVERRRKRRIRAAMYLMME